MGSLGQSLCSKLNTTTFPKLWIKPTEVESTAFGAIATNNGMAKDMKMVFQENYSSSGNSLVLQSTTSLSSDPVEKFLAGTNVANYNSGPLNLQDSFLKRGTTPVFIYEYLYGNAPLNPMAENVEKNVNTSSITVNGKSIVSVLEAFMNDSLLIKQNEIYNPPDSSGKADTSSLLRLYDAGDKVSPAQRTLKATLEQRNLRFFVAFLMEYCFYRSRYFYLLSKYFEAFQDTSTSPRTYTMLPTPSTFQVEFPTPVNTTVSKKEEDKQKYMIRLAYHMSICNIVMADMRKLLREIQVKYDGIFEQIRTALQSDTSVSSDTSVRNSIVALQTSSEKLKTFVQETEFRKAAMEYNAEKNRYGSMLLGFYAILNLSALAMIYKLR